MSLACSLIANLALLFNMASRFPFEVAQPITIIGFFIASVLLIGLLGAASRQSFIGPPESRALTQAFYYAIWAAAIYMVLTFLMLLTVVGALMGKNDKKFNLTTSQRTLMLQTISFMVYLLIGALVFSVIEGWSFLDAVFWSDFTLLTIGLGAPLTPQTHLGRSLLMPFAIGGIVSVGLIIDSIRTMLLETSRQKLLARTTEKMRARVHSYAEVENHRPGFLPNSKKHQEDDGLPERERRRREFHAMRSLQGRADSRNKWYALALSTIATCILWFIGALVFKYTEYIQGWSYFEALYFAYTSLLTIGYGDFVPLSNSGRSFFVLWSLLAIPTLTVLISDMGGTVVKGVRDVTNWLGTLTLLPGEHGTKHAWRAGFSRLKEFLAHGKKPALSAVITRTTTHKPKHHVTPAAILRSRISERDAMHAHSTFRDHETPKSAFYRWLLAHEAAKLLSDVSADPPKQYTYDEWAYFLLLLGHDESKPDLHRRGAPGRVHRRDLLSQGGEVRLGRPIDPDGTVRLWSWMGFRSPLMSSRSEAEWMLEQVLAKLRREMEGRGAVDEEDCPISLDALSEGPNEQRGLFVPRETSSGESGDAKDV